LAVASASAAPPRTGIQKLAYGVCQTGCNNFATICYNNAGRKFGTVTTDENTPTAILNCNAALGICQQACAKAV
ncbi:cysteine-rich protein, partial [Trametes versicolor FP-101664 SS1]|uniref:cysteine-rich protein n=1 Tax=Trametes versicolor (strain FP-101664) TaxID=717944 RepID=UPI00046246C7